jgi:hypothetical protein
MAAQGSAKAKGIYAKLAAAVGEVDRIAKDGTNSHFKYKYTSAEEVYRTVRGPLLKHGLVVIPQATGYEQDGQLGTVRLNLRIVDTETGESIEAQWYGEGQDKGDKAVFKAITGGMKTWLRALFLLPADDDPEADPQTDKKPAKQPSQMPRLAKLIEASDLTDPQIAQVKKWIKPNGKVLQPRVKQACDLLEGGRPGELMEIVK